jgi:hypothetical protein
MLTRRMMPRLSPPKRRYPSLPFPPLLSLLAGINGFPGTDSVKENV